LRPKPTLEKHLQVLPYRILLDYVEKKLASDEHFSSIVWNDSVTKKKYFITLTHRINVKNFFSNVANEEAKYASAIIPGKPFQPSPIFAIEA
jgi:hypothetical protein